MSPCIYPIILFSVWLSLYLFCSTVPALGLTSDSRFSCLDLLWWGSSFGLAPGTMFSRVTHSFSRFPPLHPKHFYSCSALWGFWLQLSGSALPRQLATLGLTLIVLWLPVCLTTLLFQTPEDPTSLPFPQWVLCGLGQGKLWRCPGISLEEVGKLASSVCFPRPWSSSSTWGQPWQRSWEAKSYLWF